jgi:hypothetical protein
MVWQISEVIGIATFYDIDIELKIAKFLLRHSFRHQKQGKKLNGPSLISISVCEWFSGSSVNHSSATSQISYK